MWQHYVVDDIGKGSEHVIIVEFEGNKFWSLNVSMVIRRVRDDIRLRLCHPWSIDRIFTRKIGWGLWSGLKLHLTRNWDIHLIKESARFRAPIKIHEQSGHVAPLYYRSNIANCSDFIHHSSGVQSGKFSHLVHSCSHKSQHTKQLHYSVFWDLTMAEPNQKSIKSFFEAPKHSRLEELVSNNAESKAIQIS